MNYINTIYAVISGLATIAIAYATSYVNLDRYLITLGDEGSMNELIGVALLRQHTLAFRMVVVAGIVAGLVAAGCVALILTGRATLGDKVLGIVATLADSALFRFYLKVWLNSGKLLLKYRTKVR